jgi:hypothetical protein
MAVTRLSGGLTPANGSDPRTFPAIWNATATDIEAAETDIAAIKANNWVTTARINNLAVTDAKLAADSVTTAKILDASVTRVKLATNLAAFTAQQTITATNASWAVPSLGNNTIVKVTVIGGGGGGGSANNAGNGGAGGTTTFNAGAGPLTVSAAGGAGGRGSDQNLNGLAGTPGFVSSNVGMGAVNQTGDQTGTMGLGGVITVAYLDLTGISTANVTIGAGGAASTGGNTGGAGGRGEVIVEYVAA